MKKTGVYIHIPFCRAKCDYCAFYSVPAEEELIKGLIPGYADALAREIDSRASSVPEPVDTVFFGGGSPSFLEPEQIASVFEALRRAFCIEDGAEITVEINPSDLGRGIVPHLLSAGVNRFSMGVQTLSRDLYERIGRKGGFCDAALLERYFSIHGVQHCADIIGGLPGQTPEMLRAELETLTSYSPDHISLYLLTLEEGTPLASRLVPDEGFDLHQKETLAEGIRFLKERGYEHYEVSNFALPGRRSRHNMKYWTFEPYIGFGAGAHSFIGGERSSNPADIFAYISGAPRENDRNSAEIRMAEFLMTSLRLREGFTSQRFESVFGRPLPDAVRKTVQRLAGEGSVLLRETEEGQRISVSDEAFFFSDSVVFSVVESLL